CCAHEDQAGVGGPSYSRTRNLPTVRSSTSSAWKRAFLTVTRPSASRPIASAPTATAPNAAAPIASAIMLVAGTASARRTISRGIDGLRQGLASRRRPGGSPPAAPPPLCRLPAQPPLPSPPGGVPFRSAGVVANKSSPAVLI